MLLKLPERILAPNVVVDPATQQVNGFAPASGSFATDEHVSEHPHPMAETNGFHSQTDPHFDPHAVWRQLQSELAIEQGGSFDRWVHDTWVIAYEDGEFLIGLPDAFRYDWICLLYTSRCV